MSKTDEQFNNYYLEVLNLPIKEKVNSIISCVRKSFFARVAKTLNAESMCVFLYEFASNTIVRRNICGDTQIWKRIDPYLLHRDVVTLKNFSFFKIRHTTLDGKYILIGFIGVYKNRIQLNEVKCMDLLGMIYGNYISRRIIKGQVERTNKILPQMYAEISQTQLSGTVILRVLEGFRKLMKFYRGFYFSIDNTLWYPEYLVSNNIRIILKNTPIRVSQNLLDHISLNQQIEKPLKVSQLPMLLQNMICKKEERQRNDFICYFYPMMNENTIIGLWVIVFHYNQIDDFVNITDILRNMNPLIRQHYKYLYQRRTKKMIVNPIFKERDTRLREHDVFIIMPFAENWSDSVWNHAIKPTVESLGLNAVRADDLYGQNIMEDVWKGILQSSIVIADITGRNANVFYELGIAHTLGKKVILLTQDVKDIPFDLNVYRHIIYKTDIAGGDNLKERLKNVIKEYMSK